MAQTISIIKNILVHILIISHTYDTQFTSAVITERSCNVTNIIISRVIYQDDYNKLCVIANSQHIATGQVNKTFNLGLFLECLIFVNLSILFKCFYNFGIGNSEQARNFLIVVEVSSNISSISLVESWN